MKLTLGCWLLACLPLACGSSFSAGEETGGSGGAAGASSDSCGADATCVPPGWIGPVSLLEAAAEPELPACPAELPSEIDVAATGLDAADATCSPCSCGETTATCSGGQASPGASCQLASDMTQISPTCSSWTVPRGAIDFHTAPTISGPADPCPASGGEPSTLPEPTWTRYVRVCGSAETLRSCDDGGSCVPSTDPDRSLCIFQEGELQCPTTTPFTFRSRLYRSIQDDRGCDLCVCSAPDCRSSQVSVFSEQACSGSSLIATVMPGTCQDVSASSARLEQVAGCAPSGGKPAGTATPTDPVTLCCAQ